MKTNFKILVVDDEMIMRECLFDLLVEEGFTVIKVASGEEAVEVMKKEKLNLVITDMKMPGISGLEVLQAAREFGADVKVVLMTAYAMEGNKKQYLDQGAFGFILKPFDIQQIRNMVFSAFGNGHEK